MAQLVICLDTNYLIRSLVQGSHEVGEILAWVDQGQLLTTSAICWYEFLGGPVSSNQTEGVRSLLHQIIPFTENESAEATRLFHLIGRSRKLRVDCMIAGTALLHEAHLATANRKDFTPFLTHGLKLA